MSIVAFTAIQNEGPYLLDWVAHHKALGIDELIVYTHETQDGTSRILDLMQESGYLTHLPLDQDRPSLFVNAQKQFWDTTARQKAEWLIALDVREYLNLKPEFASLKEFLELSPPNTDGIVIPRQIFGSNGKIDISDTSILFSHKMGTTAPAIFPYEATYGKTIMRNKRVFHGIGFYRPRQRPPGKNRDLSFFTSEWNKMPDYYSQHERRISIYGAYEGENHLKVNFYPLRSIADFILNGYYSGPQHRHNEAEVQYWIENNFNTIEDQSINTIGEKREEFREQILLLCQGLQSAIGQSVEWHQEQLTETIKDAKKLDLFNTCLLASSSTQPPTEIAQKLYKAKNLQEESDDEKEMVFLAEAELELVRMKNRKNLERRKGNQKKDAKEKANK